MEATRDFESGAERALDRVGFGTPMSPTASATSFRGLSTASPNSFRGLSTSSPRAGLSYGLSPREADHTRFETRRPLAITDGNASQSSGKPYHPCLWAIAGGLVVALLATVGAVIWLKTSSSTSAAEARSQRLRAAEEEQFRKIAGEQKSFCCQEDKAVCLACKAGWSVEEFCASQQNAQVKGCERQCCSEETAKCLSCKADQTVAEYCTTPGHRKVAGCDKRFCCSDMTAECLACRDKVSTKEYCSKPDNARVSGCEDAHRSSTPTTTSEPGCCTEHSAKCLACKANGSVAEFCIDQVHAKVPGCSGFCGLIENDYVYPGGNIFDVKNVANAQDCCDRCRVMSNCTAWSWGKKPGTTYHGWCYLKNQMEFIRHEDEAFVSGIPGRNTMTFQIKSRHGHCLDWGGHLHMEVCGDSSTETQQWYIDRSAGVIGTRHGLCIDSVEYLSPGGGVHLQPCTANLPSQLWVFDGISGIIRHVRGFCMDAPRYGDPGSKVRMWPCNSRSKKQLWSFWNTQVLGQSATLQAMRLEAQVPTTTTTTTTSTTELVANAANSLFCWSLMLPWGYEHRLLELQCGHGASIFACDEFAVYSSSKINITGKGGSVVQTAVVHHDLHCKIGGQFMTALNTPIFVHVWKKVTDDGRYKFHAWTIKADPDAVFFPQRLRAIVSKKEDPQAGNGIFLNNCHFGLHGPLEVVSRRSLERYGEGWKTCKQPPQEDVYLQACLLKLGAKQVDAFDLLAEEHCESKGWQLCGDDHAAFHPFKTADKYARCLQHARKFDEDRGFQAVRVLHE